MTASIPNALHSFQRTAIGALPCVPTVKAATLETLSTKKGIVMGEIFEVHSLRLGTASGAMRVVNSLKRIRAGPRVGGQIGTCIQMNVTCVEDRHLIVMMTVLRSLTTDLTLVETTATTVHTLSLTLVLATGVTNSLAMLLQAHAVGAMVRALRMCRARCSSRHSHLGQ